MAKQRKYNWPQLFQSFDEPAQTQTQFCEENNINPKYFSLKRSKYLSSAEPAFEKIEAADTPNSPNRLTIQVGRCHIHLWH